jgi:diacylglycerol O-acyltransferase
MRQLTSLDTQFMTAMSYRDHVDFGIITDRDQIDDAWARMEGTAAALDELETAICGKRPATANGRRPSRKTTSV